MGLLSFALLLLLRISFVSLRAEAPKSVPKTDGVLRRQQHIFIEKSAQVPSGSREEFTDLDPHFCHSVLQVEVELGAAQGGAMGIGQLRGSRIHSQIMSSESLQGMVGEDQYVYDKVCVARQPQHVHLGFPLHLPVRRLYVMVMFPFSPPHHSCLRFKGGLW